MASSSNTSNQTQIPFAADIREHVFISNRSYVSEPLMEKEIYIIWVSHVLILFSLTRNIHVFLDPLPRSSKKPHKMQKFFLCSPTYKPRVVEYRSFELGFMEQPNRMFHFSHTTNNNTYLN